MKSGRYGSGNTDFSKLTIKKFPTYQFTNKNGCGANALALLTGKFPSSFNGNGHGHFSDSFMVKSLRKNGFKVYSVNKSNLTKDTIAKHQIGASHLILYSQLMAKAEASWLVSYNGYIWHNFEVSAANYWDMINFPISTMYVLYKPELAISSSIFSKTFLT